MFTTNTILKKILKMSIFYFALIIGLPLLFFIIVIAIYFYFPEKDVEFFPLNDSQATYSISSQHGQYILKYDGNKSVITHTAYILHSPVDLKTYVGKKVRVTGAFITSDIQCIAKHCTKLPMKWSGLSIASIYPHLEKTCEEKNTNWGKNTYLIDFLPSGDKLVIKVASLHKDAWYTLLKPVSAPSEQFKTCVKGVKSYPEDFIASSKAGKELQERSKGVDISIGIQKPFSYQEIAPVTINVELYASKFTNEYYNLDAVLQNIAENYHLQKESDSNWKLIFTAPIGEHFDQTLPFYYEFVRVNGQEVASYSKVEFSSFDEGRSWSPL
ncbi:hypothetical protein KAZ66_02970 [Candidatus Woesebacteria bacterium]|nr:hypothetical protein [Candidatus Woesebacteria bacterium]